jgi:hypothetical protein
MFAELHCGACESQFSMDAEDESYVYPLVHRFFSAHVECGYATSIDNVEETTVGKPTIRVLRPAKLKPTDATPESEEDDE